MADRERVATPIAKPERWGWEYRGPAAVVVPYQQELPLPAVPEPTALARLEKKRQTARRGRTGLLWLTALTAGATAATAALADPALAIAPGVLTAGLAWWQWGRPVLLRRATIREYRVWVQRYEQAEEVFGGELAGWQRELHTREQEERQKAGAMAEWAPLGPATKERVDVFGGTAEGWRTMLIAMGASVLGGGGRLTVLDLSQDSVAAPLHALAAKRRAPAGVATVPAAEVNLLAGLRPDEIGVVLAEAAHVPAGEADFRTVDASLVRQLVERLTAEPVTFARLHAGLRVLMRQLGPDQSGLTRAEYAAISDSLGEAARRTAEDRIFKLAAAVEKLVENGGSGDEPVFGGPGLVLRTVQLGPGPDRQAAALWQQVAFQVLLRRLERGELSAPGSGERVLVVAGADPLARPQLERLDQVARRHRLRLVLLFAHLRDDAVDLLGGGEAVMFMRLGNAKEAEQAATFIGKEHRLVASQFTYSHGTNRSASTSTSTTRGTSSSTAVSAGTQTSDSRQATYGLLFTWSHRDGSASSGTQQSTSVTGGASWSESESTSAQEGTNTGTSVGYQRSYEYAVEPTVLQKLSPTAFVLVDPRDPASPRLGDCDPRIGATQ